MCDRTTSAGFFKGLFSDLFTKSAKCIENIRLFFDQDAMLKKFKDALTPPKLNINDIGSVMGQIDQWLKGIKADVIDGIKTQIQPCVDLVNMVAKLVHRLAGGIDIGTLQSGGLNWCYFFHYLNNANSICLANTACPYDYGFFMGARLHALALK